MTNIPLIHDFDHYFQSLVAQQHGRRTYAAVSYLSLALPSPAFVLYSVVSVLANFKTRIANLYYRRGMLRAWRSGRQIRRLLASLEDRFLVRYGRGRYSIRGRTEYLQGARMRPVNMHVLARVHDERTALYTRFVLFLAWDRHGWGKMCVEDVQRALRIRRGTAAALLEWVKTIGAQIGRKAVRRLVFFCRKPDWWTWTRRRARGRDPRRRGARFPSVRRGGNALKALEKLSECLTSTGLCPAPRPWPRGEGGRPAGRTSGNLPDATAIAGRQRDTIRGDTPRTPRPVPGRMECENGDVHRPRVTADELVAWLPENVRAKFKAQMRFVRRA